MGRGPLKVEASDGRGVLLVFGEPAQGFGPALLSASRNDAVTVRVCFIATRARSKSAGFQPLLWPAKEIAGFESIRSANESVRSRGIAFLGGYRGKQSCSNSTTN
jgi:hypothetical protein